MSIQYLEIQAANVLAGALFEGERLLWPRFGVQVPIEWLGAEARDALLRTLAEDETIHNSVLSMVEGTGAFVGLTAPSGYAAGSAVVRAIARSGVQVTDNRIGLAISLP